MEAYEGYKMNKLGLKEPLTYICLPEECPSSEFSSFSHLTQLQHTASRTMSTQETSLSAFFSSYSFEHYTFDPTNNPDNEFARLCIAR